jgi:tetratricopeptide (TPR) repeat protein
MNDNLQSKYCELVALEAEKYCAKEKRHYQSTLETFDVYSERIKHEAIDFGKAYIDHINEAFSIVLQEFAKNNEQAAINELRRGLEHFQSKFEEILEKQVHIDQSYAQLFNFSPQLLDKIYHLAAEHYKKKELSIAKKIISLLLQLDPGYSASWICLGMILKDEEHWEQSLDPFRIAAKLDPENPLPLLHMAGSCLALERKDEALTDLRRALELAAAQPKYADLVGKIKEQERKIS